jgi:hypothetical protein
MLSLADLDAFVRKQSGLLQALFLACPESSDLEGLLDFPRSGSVHFQDADWVFTRHGLGFKFANQHTSEVVDVHCDIRRPDIVDAWRLSLYYQSLGHDLSEGQARADLTRLAALGGLDRVDPWKFSLCKRSIN